MRNSGEHGLRRKERVRCAIYTRKSSEEGLEQEFNSLQAQREACEAANRAECQSRGQGGVDAVPSSERLGRLAHPTPTVIARNVS